MEAQTADSRKADTRATTWLKPDQVDRMIDACLGEDFKPHLGARNEAIVALAYDTGLRASELVALDDHHLDLDGDPSIYIPADVQKGKAATSATLGLGRYGADSSRTLKRWLRGGKWKDVDALFPSRQSDRMSTRSLRRAVKQVAEAADVRPQRDDGATGDPSDVTPHTLRHSVAYRIIQERDGRLEDVQLRLRHDHLQTTDQVYSHLIPR